MNLSYRFCLPAFFFVSFTPYFAIVHNWYVFTMCLVGHWIKVCVEFYCSARFLSVLTWNPSTLQFHNKTTTTTKHSCTLLVALRSLSFFSFYKSLQFIFEISATYREICLLSASRYLNWLICSQLPAQCISFPRAMSNCGPCDGHQDGLFVDFFFRTMYNATIIRFGFCDIRYS